MGNPPRIEGGFSGISWDFQAGGGMVRTRREMFILVQEYEIKTYVGLEVYACFSPTLQLHFSKHSFPDAHLKLRINPRKKERVWGN